MKGRRSADIATLLGASALLVLFIALRMAGGQGASFPSTYDTGHNGYAALYDLLAGERVAVRRFESPIGELPDRHVALVLAGDLALGTVAASDGALGALDAWVRAGGTLYVFGTMSSRDRRALAIPESHPSAARSSAQTACGFRGRPLLVAGDFTEGFSRECTRERAALLRVGSVAPAIAYRHGRGTIVLITSASILDNRHVALAQNARFAYALFAGARVVAFDERVYGYAAGRSFWQVLPWPVRTAIALAAFALLLALVGANLPFAPPYARPAAGERDSGAYITSLAQMLQRAGAAREIVGRLAARSEALIVAHVRTDERSAKLLERARELRGASQPDSGDVLAAGKLYAAVRKDYDR